MIPMASIIRSFEPDLLARYGGQLLPSQRRALHAMQHCRTARSPRMQVQCEACQERQFVPHSCGHRACPHCQHHESEQWLQRQLKRQVPGAYFLLTFTVPAELRALAWAHQRTVYDAMMTCSWETLRRRYAPGHLPVPALRRTDDRHRHPGSPAPATGTPMTTASVICADTRPSCCHRFLPMRAPLVLRHLPLAFHRHHGRLHRIADASTDHTGTHHRIRHTAISSHDRSGIIQIPIEQQRAMTTLVA
jgi:hypothetical protein